MKNECKSWVISPTAKKGRTLAARDLQGVDVEVLCSEGIANHIGPSHEYADAAEGSRRRLPHRPDLRATLGSKERCGRSRDVGCYRGLRPRRSQTGNHDPQLGITRAGNAYLRSLLIECSNHILRPHGGDSALRQCGLHLAGRGGKQAKSKAFVAVARKLAVPLHHLWRTQQPYMPFYEQAA